MTRRTPSPVIAGILAAMIVACQDTSSSEPAPSGTVPPSSSLPGPSIHATSPSAQPTSPYAGAETVIDVAAGPRGVAVAAGSIWVASTIGNSVQRVDPDQNQVTAEIRLVRPVTLVTLGHELWGSVLNDEPAGDDLVVRIDTASDAIVLRVSVPVFHNIAAGAGAIWAVDQAGQLRRVDPASGKATDAAEVGGMTIGIAANDAAVWGIRDDGTIWRLPASGELLEVPLGVSVPGRSRVGVAQGSGDVWVAVPGTVLALDPDDLTTRLEVSLPGVRLVNDLWVTCTDVWLSANVADADLGLDGGAVLRLDPATGEIVGTFPLGPESSGVVVADDALWAVDQKDNVLVRYAVPRP